jgi:CubicO group peptidase (beta-lactamase class C family)
MKNYFLYLFLGAGLSVNAQTDGASALDSVFRVSASHKNGFSGVVLVADRGLIKYERAFGYRDFTTHVPMQKTDLFELGSASTQFTAIVIMLLKERGLLKYDEQLEKYIDIPYKEVTIRQLLTHTSGLPEFRKMMDEHWDKSKVAGNKEIIEYLNRYKPAKRFEPGSNFAFTNTDYLLLATLAEKITGRDFSSICHEEIFAKLGMKNTAFRNRREKKSIPNLARGYLYIDDQYLRADTLRTNDYTVWLDSLKGSSHVVTNAQDFLLWDQALYTNKLVSQHTMDEAYQPIKLRNGKISNYGFGWVLTAQKEGSGRIVQQAGNNPGYKIQILRFIDKKRTLIMLCNNASSEFQDLFRQAKQIVAKY